MLKNSWVYILEEILSKILGKKAKENWGPYLRSLFDKLTIWCQLIFLLNYIMRSLLARLPPLHSENVD